MKFYQLAQAPESLVRVGQDLVDEFVRRRDFDGALQVFESSILPIVRELKLAAYVVPVRAQYAVVLAYCRRFEAAEAEMERLKGYVSALSGKARAELASQREIVARLRLLGPPPQWFETNDRPVRRIETRSHQFDGKVGRNESLPLRLWPQVEGEDAELLSIEPRNGGPRERLRLPIDRVPSRYRNGENEVVVLAFPRPEARVARRREADSEVLQLGAQRRRERQLGGDLQLGRVEELL
jgi:hypothetical protein